jgi:thioredoxin reductase
LQETGAKVGIQLQHRGRQATTDAFGYRPVAPSAIPWSPRAEVPDALSIPEIRNLAERYGRAAARAREIGLDLVEIHAAHGYLVSNFLSPDSNQRDDEYGGDVEGRARFLLEVVERVRNEVGSDFPISVTGINGSYPLTIPPFYVEKACFADLGKEIKEVVGIPVVVAGRIHELELAQRILDEKKADLIAIGRGLLADPQLPNKWREQAEGRVTHCLSCNTCIDAYWEGGGGCGVNPAMAREEEFRMTRAEHPKAVWVIGAGPAGIEAAWRAASRGHTVSLFDERAEPGGQWVLASNPPGKEHFRSFLDHRWQEIQESGVETFLGKKVEAREILDASPDAVILATGAQPTAISIPGLQDREQIAAWDVLRGTIPDGGRYLVVGGGAIGLEVAHLLATKGKDVTLVEMQERFAPEMGATLRWTLLRTLKSDGVKLLRSVKVTHADEDHLYVIEAGVGKKWKKFDAHVIATGMRSRNELKHALSSFEGELYVIGDAVAPRRGTDAVLEGARVGNSI